MKHFKNSAVDLVWHPTHTSENDLDLALFECKDKFLLRKIKYYQRKFVNIKFQIACQVILSKLRLDLQEEETITISPWFIGHMMKIYQDDDIDANINTSFEKILKSFDTFVADGSGWRVENIKSIGIIIIKYLPYRGGLKTASLPRNILNSKAVFSQLSLNDERCFLDAVIMGIFKISHNGRRSVKVISKFREQLNIDGITFPLCTDFIHIFEVNNNVSINVHIYEDEALNPVYVSINRKRLKKHINLLLYKNHYYYIKSMSRLLACIKGCGYDKKKSYVCDYCLCTFRSVDKLEDHKTNCVDPFTTVFKMPKSNTKIKFDQLRKCIRNEFIWFLDFETYQKPINVIKSPKIEQISEQVPFAACLIRWCVNPSFTSKPMMFYGEDVVEQVYDKLESEYSDVISIIEESSNQIKTYTKEEEEAYKKANKCYICGIDFTKYPFIYKVRDHNHISMEYRGAACNRCNLTYASISRSNFPIFAHNSSRFDQHLLIKGGAHRFESKDIYIIPKTSESYLLFKTKNFQFLDSFSLLPCALSGLADDLLKDGEKYFLYTKMFSQNDKHFKLSLRKGVLCYDYIKGLECLKERELPSIDNFYDKLSDNPCTEENYAFAKEFWDGFQCETLYDYVIEYLKIDTMLLCDIFVRFCELTYNNFGLDPSKFVSIASLSWQCALKYTEVSLDALDNREMFDMFQRSIRGGMCGTGNKRYAKANNHELKDFDPLLPNSYIVQLDCVSLYSYCMLKSLPYGDFEFIDENFFDVEVINQDKEKGYGYLLDVDLVSSQKHMQRLDKIPLAPHHTIVGKEYISDYSQKILEDSGGKPTKYSKLICSHLEKKNYVIYGETLVYYLEEGLILKDINRVIRFKQKPWLKPFILNNVTKRKEAKTKFSSDLFKLLNNTCYGMTLNRQDKQKLIKLVSDDKTFAKHVSKNKFVGMKIITPDLVSIELKRESVTLSRPIYVGSTILDISKEHMYKFIYRFLDKAVDFDLLYIDTDGVVIHILNCKDISTELYEPYNHLFDFSSYPTSHHLHSNKVKKKPGLFQDELHGVPISEFIALRAKMYSILCDSKNIKKLKGVKKSFVKGLSHEAYRDVLLNNTKSEASFYSIRSYNHTINTILQHKTCLSSYDDKRYWATYNHSYAHGNINNIKINKKRKRSI